ncbi:hypothetical protein BD408DRAFT_438751, partial [Parasitella parasitica]
MSRRNSSTIAVSLGSSPRDIDNGSISNVVDEEVPSRSYYSSHLAIEPGDGARYSASMESIRAHSLALGDRYMQESSPVSSPPNSDLTPQANDALMSPITPAQPNSQSILSTLLKNDKGEREPLLERHHLRKKSKDYLSTHDHDSLPNIDPESAYAIPPSTIQQQPDNPHYASNRQNKAFRPTWKQIIDPNNWAKYLTQPVSYIPAVILGLLLNLLDAISYGMITFPLNNPIFASFGPD